MYSLKQTPLGDQATEVLSMREEPDEPSLCVMPKQNYMHVSLDPWHGGS